MHENLLHFIEHAQQKGMDQATIFLLLRSTGWKDKEIAEALAARELTLPIPERAGAGSAGDAFLHLLAFTALYAWAISLICLLFTYIELAFPDPATISGWYCDPKRRPENDSQNSRCLRRRRVARGGRYRGVGICPGRLADDSATGAF